MKKNILKSIFAIMMIAALLLGCIACSTTSDNGGDKSDTGNSGIGGNEKDPGKYEGLTDAEYAQTLALEGAGTAVDALVAGVDAYAQMLGTTSGSAGAEVNLTLNLGDAVIDLVEQAIFGTADSGMDMSFLSSIGLDMEVDATDDMTQMTIALELASKKIVDLVLLTDLATLWAGIPELADGYLEIGLEDIIVAEAATPAYVEMLTGAIADNNLAEILNRYLAIVIKEFDKVERTTETLSLEGISQEATKLTIKIYEQDALDAAKAVLTAAKDDKDLKKLVEDFGDFYNEMMEASYADLADYGITWEDVDLYAEFSAFVDQALTELPAEAETEEYFAVVLYVDDKHNVIGSALDLSVLFADVQNNEATVETASSLEPQVGTSVVGAMAYTAYTVTDGNNFASIIESESAGIKITGKGTTNKGVITGTYTVTFSGMTVGTIELKNFDTTDKDAVSGTVTLKPSADIIEYIFNGPIPVLEIEDVALELMLDITNDKANVEAKLIGDDAMIVGIALKLATKTPGIIQKPTGTVDITDYAAFMNWVSGINFEKVFNNLDKAGVPEVLLSALENLVPAM